MEIQNFRGDNSLLQKIIGNFAEYYAQFVEIFSIVSASGGALRDEGPDAREGDPSFEGWPDGGVSYGRGGICGIECA